MDRSSSSAFALTVVLSCSAILAAGSGGCGGNIGYFPDGGTSDAGGGGTPALIRDGGPDSWGNVTPPRGDGGLVVNDGGSKKKDASAPPFDDDAGTCAPDDVSSYVPQWKPPLRSTVCTAQKVTDLMTCVFDINANATTCDPITKDPANQPCMDCLLTPSSKSSLGAVVIEGNIGTLNIPGCVALATANTTASGCGAKLQASDGCKSAACSANCPITDDASVQALEACEADVATNDCSTYAASADACSKPLLAAGGAAANCAFGSSTFLDKAIAFGKMFCAP